jgi:hypothetical protein
MDKIKLKECDFQYPVKKGTLVDVCSTNLKSIKTSYSVLEKLYYDVKSVSDTDLLESVILIKKLQDELENISETLKSEILKREIKETIFEELDTKIGVIDSNSKTEYDIDSIFKKLKSEKFLKIVNIVDSKAKESLDKEDYFVVQNNSRKVLSEKKIVSIRKLAKKDLLKD